MFGRCLLFPRRGALSCGRHEIDRTAQNGANSPGSRELIERMHRRVARQADGWMTSLSEPGEVGWRLRDVREKVREVGRDPAGFPTCIYHNINVNEDRPAALAETKRFLDTYYMADFPMQRVESWTAAGSPQQCVEHLRVYEGLGIDAVALRCTSWNQMGQLRRVIEDVLPNFAGASASVPG